MSAKALGVDLAVGLAAGYVATKITEQAQMALWKLTPVSTRKEEQAVRPGPPPKVAVAQTTELFDLDLDQKQAQKLAQVFHYGLGLGWAPMYGLLRRYSQMSPLGAGVITGMSMSIIVDEALNPALGFTAPSKDYPPAAHVRGVLGHLVFGLAVACSAELLYRVTGRRRP